MAKLHQQRIRIPLIFGCLLFGAVRPLPAFADDGGVAESLNNSFKPDRVLEARILPDPAFSKHIKKISWEPGAVKVTTRYFGSSSESTLHLEGKLAKKDADDWHLVWADRSVEVDESGSFGLDIPFEAKQTRIQLVAVGPGGEVEYHFYRVKIVMPGIPAAAATTAMMGEIPVPKGPEPVMIPEPAVKIGAAAATETAIEAETEAETEAAPESAAEKESIPVLEENEFNAKLDRRLFASPGIGITSLSYTQTGRADYTAIMTTVKVSANYLLFPPKWDLGFSGFMNVASLSKSASSDIRAIGTNLRVGYIFPEVKAPWRLSLYGGWYYSTMFASDSTFGYQNVSGPQLYPAIRRTLDNGCAVSAYLKFSPISSSGGIMKLSNNETAIGFGFFIPGEGRTYGITLDMARISFSQESPDEETVSIQSTSLSLGGSVTF